MREVINYVVDNCTLGLREANHPEYATIISDIQGDFYSRKPAIELLNDACLQRGGADYRGKIAAIRHRFNYYNKTPLIISLYDVIYMFPTKSPTHYDCRWICPVHIKSIEVIDEDVYVLFKNGTLFPVNCSVHTLYEQWKRASHCFIHYVH